MPRPRLCRKIKSNPNITFYKPIWIPTKELEITEISLEEWESIRLKNVEWLDQTEAAKVMNTSQSTFQRILTSAHKKLSTAIVNGMAIKIITSQE